MRSRYPYILAGGVLAALLIVLATGSMQAPEPDRISVGALRFTSSGPLFLARDRGYFAAESLDVEINFFDAAPTIAIAVASGDLTFGSSALTAAFFNLAGEGQLRIVAGQAREERGHPGNVILVTRRVFEQGFTGVPALAGQLFGLTQFGSPSHYQLGQVADRHGIAFSSVPIRAFQTLPNLVAAIRSNQVSWAIIAPPIASDLVEAGYAVSLGPYSDLGSFQFGVVFTRRRTLDSQPDLVRRFLRAYERGIADYAAIQTSPVSVGPGTGEQAQATARAIARYVYPDDAPEDGARKVLRSALYVDPSGRVDLDDIRRQIRWYHEQGLIRRHVEASEVLMPDLLR